MRELLATLGVFQTPIRSTRQRFLAELAAMDVLTTDAVLSSQPADRRDDDQGTP